jgi:hypothetical protein
VGSNVGVAVGSCIPPSTRITRTSGQSPKGLRSGAGGTGLTEVGAAVGAAVGAEVGMAVGS